MRFVSTEEKGHNKRVRLKRLLSFIQSRVLHVKIRIWGIADDRTKCLERCTAVADTSRNIGGGGGGGAKFSTCMASVSATVSKYEFKLSKYEFKLSKYEFKLSKYEFKLSKYEFKLSKYEFKLSKYEFKLSN